MSRWRRVGGSLRMVRARVGSGWRGAAVELCLVGRPGARLKRGRWPAWGTSAQRWSGGEVGNGEMMRCNAEELVDVVYGLRWEPTGS